MNPSLFIQSPRIKKNKGIPLKIACIVPGSYIQIWDKKEIKGPQKADDMFLGRFSSISKKYAKEFYKDSYFYFTTKQGLLAPSDIVITHEITDRPSFDDPKAIKIRELKKQCKKLGLKDYDLIVFLGTKHLQKQGWVTTLEQVLDENKERLYCPLVTYEEENLGLAKIKDAIITGVPLFFPDNRSPVRLKKIEILKLFDQYDYPNISLFTRERLTIIVAPNGFGKTTIMELLYRICALKTADETTFGKLIVRLQEIPFKLVRLTFDNNTSITFQHSKDDKTSLKENELFFYLDELIDQHNLTLKQKFVNVFPFIPVKFIKSSRLTDYSKYSIRKKKEQGPETTLLKTYSNEIKDRIGSLFYIYSEVTDDYDCSAMKRLIELPDGVKSFHKFQRSAYSIYNKEQAIEELLKLEKEREILRDAGFLMVNQGLKFQADISKITKNTALLRAITLHIRDSQEKYQLFQMLREKMNLLENIIKDLFLDKKFIINYDNGFEVIRNGKIIDISKLSSGEQHQIVLYYDLIFNSEPGTLVLIDEPEISIHIEWQRQFLKNLQKISKIINCDFIVTTHSPDIVNDKWNLIMQLNEGTK